MASKHAKEAFVTGHTGTTLLEVTCISFLPILAAYLTTIPVNLSPWRQALVIVIVCTVGLMSPHGIALCGAAAAMVVKQHATYWGITSHTTHPSSRALWLSQYRGTLVLLTCIAILAVDFPAFPRRFVKTEITGTGLMDTGVGAFVFSSTCTAALGRVGTVHDRRRRHQRIVLRGVVLLLLGMARVLVTAAVDYQQHVGEYGVHWNFFFTLVLAAQPVHGLLVHVHSATTLYCAACHSMLHNMGMTPSSGICMSLLHQALLTWAGVDHTIASPQRGPGWVSLNKEGVYSCPGYTTIALLGAAIGRSVGGVRGSAPRSPLRILVLIATAAWCALLLVQQYAPHLGGTVSRRACNMSYILWTVALNSSGLALCRWLWGDATETDENPTLLSAFSAQQLPVFLLANVLTGVVNMTVDTLIMPDWLARVLVCAYGMAVAGVALWMTSGATMQGHVATK